ncbi:nucleoside diphosphate kinase regulator [uncultured Paraglaciecola sp.]|uniref:nucleoside diphosphate kinase regulator n=1 Tax=uncultured Paraglaciecola sp. TaxID=1765024 RepID=UPI0030DD7276|tara:strand:+ start:2291 stop:2677 length:387 start_codon:yes stop_codon:yes gene_type:complete
MDTQPDIIISTADLAELEFQLERSKLPAEVIRAIENELDRATIVACKDLPQDVVAIGSQVTFKILDTQRTFTKTLCLPADTIKFEDSISVFAPIGSALIGLSTGQCIKWQTQRGEQSVEIINVDSNKR